jgi:hypothetical protein
MLDRHGHRRQGKFGSRALNIRELEQLTGIPRLQLISILKPLSGQPSSIPGNDISQNPAMVYIHLVKLYQTLLR